MSFTSIVRRVRALLGALPPAMPALAALALVGCNPCDGVVGCRQPSHISASGRVIDFFTGRGVAGVTVTFRRTGGLELQQNSIVATTDAEGHYRLAADAPSDGEAVGDVTIESPGAQVRYGVPAVHLQTSSVGGGGTILPTWTAQPYVAWVGSVVALATGEAAAWGNAVFTRTGGARLAEGDRLRADADGSGYFFLRGTALDTGYVEGDLQVNGDGVLRYHTIRGVRLRVKVADAPMGLDRVLRIGTSFNYVLELYWHGSNERVAGAAVAFRRTAGPKLDSAVTRGVTDAQGRVRLDPIASTDTAGVLVGDLTVTPPGSAKSYTIRGVQLPSFDSDELRFLGVFGIGSAVQVAGELWSRGERRGIADADVQFVRTGGIAARPATVQSRSIATGYFGIGMATDTTGIVVGDLIVRTPGAATPVTFHGVQLRAYDDDSVRYGGQFRIGAGFSYAGMLMNRATGKPAEGFLVTFTRTSGIRLLSDTSTNVVVDWGGFSIAPATSEEGSVTGTLTARDPRTGATTLLGSVTLRTMDSDTVPLVGQWSVGPSLLYVGELRRVDTGAPIAGARAEFHRTGGVATADSVAGETTNAEGRFRMALVPLAAGDVIGDLLVHPPAPMRDTVFRNIRVPTFEADETRLAGVWYLAVPK